MVSASNLQAVDLGFISKVGSYQETSKNSIQSFPTWRSAEKRECGKQLGKLACCALGKTLTFTPPSLCGREKARPSSLPVLAD